MTLEIDPQRPRYSGGRPALEAVIVCVDYSDFLAETLPRNRNYFDHITVVTSFDDKETQRVCRKYSLDPVLTESFYEHGDTFAKARGINCGLNNCKYNDWILHLDADILLPENFRTNLFMYPLQKDCIYGADRQNIIGREAYDELVESNDYLNQHDQRFLLRRGPYDNGSRLVNIDTGYSPIGYFQLFNGKYLAEHKLKYPYHQRGADRTDVQFALQWPMVKRILLPTVSVFHLESNDDHKQGANWNGRTTAEF